jgi:hypothetical protein
MSRTEPIEWSTEPFPLDVAERTSPNHRRVRALGRVRLPLAGPYRPWATLYRMPDGRRLWCVRLWELDGPVTRCFSTGYLVAFARLNGLDALREEIERIARPE